VSSAESGTLSVADFRASMPPSYRKAHSRAAIEEHAAIAARRGSAPVHAELWRFRRGAVIVMVTDDRDGLLAMMSAAVATMGFDILTAEAYQRARATQAPEAVALFELRRPAEEGRALTATDVAAIAVALQSLLRDELASEGVLRRNAGTVPPGPQASPDVTFADEEDSGILLVEARDRPGLLAAITSCLAEARVRIVDCEIVTVGGRVRDRFELVEADGGTLSLERRDAIARSVLASIERRASE
jgi:UTP:GlnB (protein PII) uridylyltransferase